MITPTPRRGLLSRLVTARTPGQWLALLTGLVGAAAGIYLMTDDAIHSGHWTLEHILMPPVVLIAIASGLLTHAALRENGWRGVPAALAFAAIFTLATYVTVYQSAGRMASSAGTQVAAVTHHNDTIIDTRRALDQARADIKELGWLIQWETAGRPKLTGKPSLDGVATGKTGCGTICKGYTLRKTETEAKAERLKAQIDGIGPVRVAQPKARNAAELVSLLGADAAKAERIFGLVERFAWTLLFELTAIVALHYGFGHRRRGPTPPPAPTAPPSNGGHLQTVPALIAAPTSAPVAPLTHPVIAALTQAGRPLNNNELAVALGVTKGEASKSWREVEDRLTVIRHGREIRIAVA